MSALLQLHRYFRLNTWSQWIGQRQLFWDLVRLILEGRRYRVSYYYLGVTKFIIHNIYIILALFNDMRQSDFIIDGEVTMMNMSEIDQCISEFWLGVVYMNDVKVIAYFCPEGRNMGHVNIVFRLFKYTGYLIVPRELATYRPLDKPVTCCQHWEYLAPVRINHNAHTTLKETRHHTKQGKHDTGNSWGGLADIVQSLHVMLLMCAYDFYQTAV